MNIENPSYKKPRNEDNVLWTIMGYLLSGMLIWGGIGWGLDKWLGTQFLVIIGLLAGTLASLGLVWMRFGRN